VSPKGTASRDFLGGFVLFIVMDYDTVMSVSPFQDKEKRGEMITKNDNIK
jgi:hypothetical protein